MGVATRRSSSGAGGACPNALRVMISRRYTACDPYSIYSAASRAIRCAGRLRARTAGVVTRAVHHGECPKARHRHERSGHRRRSGTRCSPILALADRYRRILDTKDVAPWPMWAERGGIETRLSRCTSNGPHGWTSGDGLLLSPCLFVLLRDVFGQRRRESARAAPRSIGLRPPRGGPALPRHLVGHRDRDDPSRQRKHLRKPRLRQPSPVRPVALRRAVGGLARPASRASVVPPGLRS